MNLYYTLDIRLHRYTTDYIQGELVTSDIRTEYMIESYSLYPRIYDVNTCVLRIYVVFSPISYLVTNNISV